MLKYSPQTENAGDPLLPNMLQNTGRANTNANVSNDDLSCFYIEVN